MFQLVYLAEAGSANSVATSEMPSVAETRWKPWNGFS